MYWKFAIVYGKEEKLIRKISPRQMHTSHASECVSINRTYGFISPFTNRETPNMNFLQEIANRSKFQRKWETYS